MNFAGKSGFDADVGSGAHGRDSLSHTAEIVTIPDAHLLFAGDYERSGSDLIVSDQLHRVVVPDYFHGDKRPTLVSPEGAPLDPKFIDALTGHVQYAQAGPTAVAAKVVGHVVKMTGSASIVRNGVTITLNNGDVVYQNDVVQTGSGSTLGLVMIDGTTFNLTASARLMMNDLTYDANSTSNTALFTLVQGAANFVAGQVAKTGDMKVGTPVATMGIRGTAVILDISSVDGTVSISVVDQRDGQVHAVEVRNSRGDLIGMVRSNGSTLTLSPTTTFEVIAQESNKTVAQVATEFNAFQQLLSTYDIGKQMAPDTPAPTDGRRGDANPQTTIKFAGTTIMPSDSSATKFNADIGNPKAVNTGLGITDPATQKPTGDLGGAAPKLTEAIGDAPLQLSVVAAASIPFVVTPSAVSRISSEGGDHFGPVMSADGRFVTYDPDGAIFLFDRQSGKTITIASPEHGFTYGSPTISSDGHFIVYQGSDGTGSFIFIYNNDASDPQYGHTSELGPGGQPAVSGDGSKIVVERGGSIALFDQHGQPLATITAGAVGTTGTLWKPAISADGHVIAFWSSDQPKAGGAGQLFTYDLSTATFRSIASTATDAGNSAASFSADGHVVVYQSDAPGGHSEISLQDLRTGQVVFHTANAEGSYSPVISPDGNFIIFASDARLTGDDKNNVADIYVVDVTDLAHPVFKLISVLDDGTQGNAASDLGAAISAGGQFVAFGSSASNFATGDTPGSGDIFVVDASSGHSAIILEGHNSPAVLTTGGVIKLTGAHSGVSVGVSDTRITASFDAHGDIQWQFSEPRSDFAALQPGQISVQNFVVTLSTERSTTSIPLKISIYDVDQAPAPAADAAPVANPVTLAAGAEDTAYTITSAALLAGVTDVDGPALSITALGIASGGGTILDNHDGTFSYTPAPNYNGPVVFNYIASDGTLSASSTASLNLAAVNDAPQATPLNGSVSEDDAVQTIDLLTSAHDVDNDPLSATHFGGTAHDQNGQPVDISAALSAGAIVVAGNNVTVDPHYFNYLGAGESVTLVADYDISDGHALAHNTATLTIQGVNDAPETEAPVVPDPGPIRAPAGTRDGHGGYVPLVLSNNFGFTDADVTDTHTISAAFNAAASSLGPLAGPIGTFDQQLIGDSGGGNDGIVNWSFTLSSDELNDLNDHAQAGAVVREVYDVTVDDGHGGRSLRQVTIEIDGPANSPNHAPQITAAALAVSEGGTVVLQTTDISVSDSDSASFAFTVSNVSHGTFQTSANGNVWTNAATFTTADLALHHVRFVHDGSEIAPTFSIQANDGASTNNLSNVQPGSVSFTNVNDAPLINTAALTISEGETAVLGPSNLVVTDPDNNSLVFTASNVSHGSFETTTDDIHWVPVTTFNTTNFNDHHVRFVHDGSDNAPTFSLQANDGAGGLSNVAAGAVQFSNVNDAPTTTAVTLGAMAEDGGARLIDQQDLLAHASDVEGDSLTASNLQISAGSGVLVDHHDGTWSYTPALNDDGSVSFSYTITDNGSTNGVADHRSVAGSASLDLTPVNDAPTTTAVTLAAMAEDGGARLIGQQDLLAHASDVEGDSLTASDLQISAGSGVLVDHHDGTWSYTPALDDDSAVSFSYTITDDGSTNGAAAHRSVAGSASLDLTPVNDAPVVTAGHTLNYTENQVATAIDPAIILSDVDSAKLASATVQITANYVNGEDVLGFTDQNGITGSFDAATGTLALTGSSSVANYQAALASVRYVNTSDNPSGAARAITIVTNDGALDSAAATDTINVTPVNDAPVLTSAALTVSEGDTVVLQPSDIVISDPDSASFTFTVSNVSHGTFQTTSDGSTWNDASTFTTADLEANHVHFVHDGGEDAPTFSLQANDGEALNHLSATVAGVITFTKVNDAPDLTSAALTVSEGDTVVLQPSDIVISDPDSASFTFTVSNVSHGTFQTTSDGSTWNDASTFTTADLEANHVHFVHDGGEDAPTFSLQANDGAGGLSSVVVGTVDFTNVNDAPSIAAQTLAAILEDAADPAGESVADLFGPGFQDPDAASSLQGIAVIGDDSTADQGVWQYRSSGGNWEDVGSVDPQNALIFSSDTQLRFLPAPDYNGTPGGLEVLGVDNTYDDGFTTGSAQPGGRYTEDVSLRGGATPFSATAVTLGTSVTAVNDAPVITSDDGGATASLSVAENTKAVTTVHATDVDSTILTYSIVTGGGSPDAAKFSIDQTTGALAFINAPDFENPKDSNHNNIYTVQVNVFDGSLSDTQTLYVHVTDVNDNAPVITTGAFQFVAENHSFVTHLTAFDVDTVGDATTFDIADGSDGSLFTIVDGDLQFVAAPDFEHPADGNQNNIYTVQVTAFDGAQSASKTLFVQVTNVNEAPVLAPDASAVTYTENAAALALLSGGTITDPDNPANFDGGSLSVTLNGARSGDELVLAATAGVTVTGSSVKVGGTTVGTISGNHSTNLSVVLNSNATDARVEAVLHALAFDSSSDNPTNADRTATITFNDGSNDGSGPALSDSSTVTIHVTPVNDAPHAFDDTVITNNANNGTYKIPEWVLLANDTDPDSAVLDVTLISSPSGFVSVDLTSNPGSVTIHDNSPVGGSFNYTASDGSSIATAHVTVTQASGTMNGGSGNEIFIGDSFGSAINAKAGDDILIGNGGNDTLDGGPGNDIYVFGLADGRDTIAHSSGVDTIRIAAGGATLTGLGFAEDSQDNLVIQFNGQQITVTDQFDDSTVGALQFDGGATYAGYDLGGDLYAVSNDSGSSRSGTSGNDILSGDAAGNTISGGDGKDLLFGNAGNDTLNGGSGNDLLVGGAGDDLLSGGPGNDTFVFAPGSGHDTVADFIAGQDKISLDYHAFNTGDFSSWLNSHALSVNNGRDVLIDLSGTGHSGPDTILLQSVALANLHVADFIVQ